MGENHKTFGDFERDGWSDENLCQTYHERFAKLTHQAIPSLLDAAMVRPGATVLDVATGAGYAAQAARERGAITAGIDFSAAQIALARSTYPDIDFQIDNAETLSFNDATYDAVFSNFGILHFPNPKQFLKEAFRILRPGGNLAFTAWRAADGPSGFGIVLNALSTYGSFDVGLPQGPDFFQFSDADYCQESLSHCGFEEIVSTSLQLVWEIEDPDDLCETIMQATVRTATIIRHQSKEAQSAIMSDIRTRVRAFADRGKFSVPMPISLCRASHP